MRTMKFKLLILCFVVSALVGLTTSPAMAATILWKSANTDIYLGMPISKLEYENPLAGNEMIKGYAIKEWRDADYAAGPPRWYDDWNVNDPANIDGSVNEIWMRRAGNSIWTTTTIASSTVSIHLIGDNNDGLADILVDGILVAKLDMGSAATQTALIIVKNLANIAHHIQVNDRGYGPNFGDDVATLGAAALEKRIKWSQPPKPAQTTNLYYGWNEISDYNGPQIVADDWECTNDDPVTDIHWWGSFINWTSSDDPPVMPSSFHITFWTDVPANPDDPDSFSHPNDVVWEIDCTNFTFDFVGWDYDPRTKCYEACFYFEQFLTEAEYFIQHSNPDGTPNIYWISIAAEYPAGTIVNHPWGWKTRPRDPMSPAPDDAVIIRKPTKPHIGDRYQDGKPIYWPDPDYSWDMAFELTSQTIIPEIKWEQQPNTQLPGLHCHDYINVASGPEWITIADDWQCRGGQVTDLHWYGNYEEDASGNEMKGSGIRLFHLSIHYTNPLVACLPTLNEIVGYGFDVPISAITVTDTGLESSDQSKIYLYEYDLPNPFPQELDQFYWLDITAISVDPQNPPMWRWQEAARVLSPSPIYFCPAVTRTEPPLLAPWQPIAWPDDTYSHMAFAITSHAVTQGEIKWSQKPEPYHPKAYDGWNEESVYNMQQIAADDWFCNTADPVTDIHWWGSFIGWSCEDPPQIPDSFHIAIWTDVPADPTGADFFSHPGIVIWETDCNNFTVEFDGWDIDPRDPFFTPPETCYKFSLDLEEDEWFRQKYGNNIYWISIAAKYPAGTTVQHPWGWKTRLRDLNSRAPDDAVRIYDPLAPILGSMYFDGWPIYWPTMAESWDLAFELTTKEQPPKPPVPHLKWSQPPIEINKDGIATSYKLYATTFEVAVDKLLSVSPVTGAGTLIGNMSTQTPFGLSDRGTELYTFDSGDANSIVKIDPATGSTLQKIVINPPGITGEGGLSFRSDDIGFLTSAMGNAGQLWSFDITVPSSTSIGAVTPSMDGLDFNGSNVLYGLKQSFSAPPGPYELYTINQATGATTLVGSTGVIATGTVGGLTFAPDGTLYAAINDNLYTVNPGTGTATLVGPIGYSGVCGLTALPAATASTLPVYCGWNEESYLYERAGAPPSMKVVADDYLCIGSMPVTSVHWWGSYIGWDLPEPPVSQPTSWIISFWSNVPAGIGGFHYSYPEELLHQFRVPHGRVKIEMVGIDEFLLNPDIFPEETCFQYYVDLNRYEIFWQNDFIDRTQDNTFWISIVADYSGNPQILHKWGWKTRPWSWSDDAVTFDIEDPPPIGDPINIDPTLIKPLEHQGESYDVAFELDTDPNYIKWEQPFTGIRNWPHYEDVNSFAIENAAGDLQFINLVADDWECRRTTPVTAVVWWGSYIGFEYQACQDTTFTRPTKPDYFRLSIWTDVPSDPAIPGSFSHPNDIIWKYDAYDYAEVLFGFDKHPLPIPGTNPFGREPVFSYSVRLPRDQWFRQRGIRDIYWLSVVAVYKGGSDPTHDWGWTNHPHVFNDDAVTGIYDPPAGWFWEELYDQLGDSEDMSFMLFTDPSWPPCWNNPCQPYGDYNGDGLITAIDIQGLVNAWGGYDVCADFNQDGFITAIDIQILVNQWGNPCP